MNRPLVSLIICCYNRAEWLPLTLESALSQRYRPVEIIVLDDGSEDGTAELMAGYGDRIRYHRQENQGIAAARSNACRLATGEFITFLDDDDLMPPDRIERLLGALRQHPSAVFAVGDLAYIDEKGEPTGKRWLPENHYGTEENILFEHGDEAVLWPRVAALPHTTLFRRADGERIGWFDGRYRFAAEDKDFYARLGRLGPVVYVPHVVSLYRQGHASLTRNAMRTWSSQLQLFENHLAALEPDRAAFRRRLQWRILTTLKQMERYRAAEGSGNVPEDDRSRALALLPWQDRMRYYWFAGKMRLRGRPQGESSMSGKENEDGI